MFPETDIVWTGVPSELDPLEFPSVELTGLDQHLWLVVGAPGGHAYSLCFHNTHCFSAMDEQVYALAAERPFEFPNRLNFTEESVLLRGVRRSLSWPLKHYFVHSGERQWQAVASDVIVQRHPSREAVDNAWRARH